MSIEDYLYTTSPTGANIALSDLEYVLPTLLEAQPKIIVEIGTFYGGSARLWQHLFRPDVLITIDRKKLAADMDFCHYLSDHLSQDPRTVAAVTDFLDGAPIDFLFIDGGHLYDEVKADFETYAPLVRAGGIVMFHDIHNHNPGVVEVPRYWQELKLKYDVIETPEDGCSGLGIVVG